MADNKGILIHLGFGFDYAFCLYLHGFFFILYFYLLCVCVRACNEEERGNEIVIGKSYVRDTLPVPMSPFCRVLLVS